MQRTLKYLHTAHSRRFYPYRQPLTHLHCSICTIVPMPMKQLWRILVYKPQKSSRTHQSTQTKHNKIMCVFYGLYCITGVWFRRHWLLQLENSAQENDSFFFQIVLKTAGNNIFCPECWSRTLTGSEFAHHAAYIWQNAVIPTMLFILHRLSTYQWFHITYFWQKIYYSWQWRHTSVMASQTTGRSTVFSNYSS